MKKIAFIVSFNSHHTSNGGLTLIGRLQITDLIVKAATWFGVKTGQEFMRKTALLCDRRPENLEGAGLASGLAREFADWMDLNLLPYGWSSSGCSPDEEKSTKLIEAIDSSKRESAIVFGYFSGRRDESGDHCDVETYLDRWGISAEGLPVHCAEAYAYLVDLEAKTVEFVPCVFSRE